MDELGVGLFYSMPSNAKTGLTALVFGYAS